MKANDGNVNVILLDWSGLAFFIQAPDWDSYLYDSGTFLYLIPFRKEIFPLLNTSKLVSALNIFNELHANLQK